MSGAGGGGARGAAWLAATLLGTLSGCGREAPLPAESQSLADLLGAARVVVETRSLDFGAAPSRASFWSGWGPDERSAGATFVWGSGESSSLRLDLVDRRSRRLTLRGWSLPFGGDPPQEVTVLLNGREIGRRLVPARPTDLELEIRGDAWRAGENLLELRYARHEDGAPGLARAVAWDGLHLSGGGSPPAAPPGRTPEGDLELPAGTALEWTLELPGDTWLAWSRAIDRAGARLEVAVESEGEDHERRAEAGAGAARFRLAAAGEPRRLRRFSLRAISARGEGSVRIEGARLHSPGLPGASAPAPAATSPAPASRPNVVIYIIDTLRADHLGCYGYPRATSPNIDRFARGATLFREGRAQASWTRPAVATILTGLYPITHQAQRVTDRLSQEIETLAERMSAAGYETAMFTASPNVAGRFGFRQGFDRFVPLFPRRSTGHIPIGSAAVNRRVFQWLDHRAPDRPFFLVVHTVDPHDPYTPSEQYRELLARDVGDLSIGTHASVSRLSRLSGDAARHRAVLLEQLYDAEIAENDVAFGALVDRLGQKGLGSDTAWFLVADHGEEFFDHGGWTHGVTLYEEQLRIPFVVRLPRGVGAGRIVATPADQIDVAPTVLDLAGVGIPAELPGHSLVEEIAHGDNASGGPSFAFLDHDEHRAEAIVDTRWKLLRIDRGSAVPSRPPLELYALESDPGEHQDLALARPLRRLWLDGELGAAESRFQATLAPVRVRIDGALAARLRALGYLH